MDPRKVGTGTASVGSHHPSGPALLRL